MGCDRRVEDWLVQGNIAIKSVVRFGSRSGPRQRCRDRSSPLAPRSPSHGRKQVQRARQHRSFGGFSRGFSH